MGVLQNFPLKYLLGPNLYISCYYSNSPQSPYSVPLKPKEHFCKRRFNGW